MTTVAIGDKTVLGKSGFRPTLKEAPMRTWAHWTAKTVMLTAGVVAAGAGFSGVAFAASPGGSGGAGAVTSGLGSVLGGNQASAPVSLPVDVCGNAAAVLGLSLAGCGGGASSASSAGPASATGGTGGLGSAGVTRGAGSVAGGNQVSAPVSAPVSACGNEAGHAAAHCGGGATVTWSGSPRGTTARTSGRGSVAGGNQFNAPVTTPVSVCGNAAAVLGDSAAGCEGSASAGSAAGRTFADAPDTGLAPGRSGGTAADGAGSSRGGGTTGSPAVPATTLAVDSPAGLSNISIYSLAIGALVAGVVALKMAGRRFRGHHSRGHRV
jgi:hypothetical protein